MKKLNSVLLWVAVLTLGGVVAYQWMGPQDTPVFGGVTQGNEYTATTTHNIEGVYSDILIKGGPGALGSLVVTKAGDVEFRLVNATSVEALSGGVIDVQERTLARAPASLVAGTYMFDVTFTDGLVFDLVGGQTGSTTITYR